MSKAKASKAKQEAKVLTPARSFDDGDEDFVRLERQLDEGKLTISWPRGAEAAEAAETVSEGVQLTISFTLETRIDDYHLKLGLEEIVKLHRMLTVEPTLIYDSARAFASREVKIDDRVATIALPLKVGSKVAQIAIKMISKRSEIKTLEDKNAFELAMLRKRVEELERGVVMKPPADTRVIIADDLLLLLKVSNLADVVDKLAAMYIEKYIFTEYRGYFACTALNLAYQSAVTVSTSFSIPPDTTSAGYRMSLRLNESPILGYNYGAWRCLLYTYLSYYGYHYQSARSYVYDTKRQYFYVHADKGTAVDSQLTTATKLRAEHVDFKTLTPEGCAKLDERATATQCIREHRIAMKFEYYTKDDWEYIGDNIFRFPLLMKSLYVR